MTTKYTLRTERKATHFQEGIEVVSINGCEVGFLTKYQNAHSFTHPWKAFAGIGENARFLGSFFSAEGGKIGAIKAILIDAGWKE